MYAHAVSIQISFAQMLITFDRKHQLLDWLSLRDYHFDREKTETGVFAIAGGTLISTHIKNTTEVFVKSSVKCASQLSNRCMMQHAL